MFIKYISLATNVVLFLGFISNAFTQVSFKKHVISSNLSGAYWVYARDVNKDGRMDLVTAAGQGIAWWKGNGSGGFAKSTLGSLTGAWGAFAEDIDGDGKIDILGVSPTTDEVVWYKNNGGGFGGKKVIDASGRDPEAVAAADFDNDGDGDVVAALWEDGAIAWYENRGNDNWTKRILDGSVKGAHSVYVADFNKDGRVDIVASGSSVTRWYSNSGGGSFSKRGLSSSGSWGVSAVDVNQDGRPDILRTQRDNGDVDWFRNTGGGFSENNVAKNYGESWGVSGGDIDNDGDVDIVAAGFEANNITAWLNNGGNSFGGGVIVDNVNTARSVFVAKLDKSGGEDIAAAIRGDRDLNWYEANGSGGGGPTETITVDDPNGGESYEPGQTIEIRWSSTGSIDAVDIEFTSNDGNSWSSVTSNENNDGKYNWTVPDVSSADCRVRISDAADGDPSDKSNSVFTIQNIQPSIQVSVPDGGESYEPSEAVKIKWTSTGAIAKVDIEFSSDDGATWATVSNNETNDGTYNWTVPNAISALCRIRITDSANGSVSDQSKNTFSIENPQPVIQVNVPDGGESYEPGEAVQIKWTSAGPVNKVDIEFSSDDGSSWSEVSSNEPNDGIYNWTVPDITSSDCRVRITDSENSSVSDQSKNKFTVQRKLPTLQVTAPDGGEEIEARTTYSVRWNSTSSVTGVKIEFSPDAGVSWSIVENTTENDSRYDWLVPNVESDQCFMRISDSADSTISDRSDAKFKIYLPEPVQPELTAFSPGNGVPGTEVTIIGKNFLDVSSVLFETIPADFLLISEQELQCIVPDSARTGRIKVISPEGIAESLSDFIVLPDRPLVQQSYLPSSDAQIRYSERGKNFGDSDFLKIQKGKFVSYLKFQVPDSSLPLLTSIKIFSRNAGEGAALVYQVNNTLSNSETAWDESNLTAGNVPEILGTPVSRVAAIPESSFVAFDVTSVVKSAGDYSFALKSDIDELIRFDSKEANFQPELVLTFSAPIDSADNNNVAPVAIGDTVQVFEDSMAVLNPLQNDYDEDGTLNALTLAVLTQPVHGEVIVDSLFGSIEYRPDDNYFGADSLRYNIEDDAGDPSNSAVIKIEVLPVNDVPVAVDDSATTFQGELVEIELLANDYDIDDALDTTHVEIVTQPAHGQVAVDSLTGILSYSPDSGFYGQDSLSYRVYDVSGAPSNGAAVRISVTRVNRAPVILAYMPKQQTLTYTATDTIAFAVRAADADADSLLYEWRLDDTFVSSDSSYSFVAAEPIAANYTLQVAVTDGEAADSMSWSLDYITITSVDGTSALPTAFSVSQNYPNPFNPQTRIDFALPAKVRVKVVIYDLLGREIRVLQNSELEAGYHSVLWDATDAQRQKVSSGIYFYRIASGANRFTGKMLLVQ